ncbi:restriction endonuclease subunit S, partial [Campylobacter sp. FMV-PI01]
MNKIENLINKLCPNGVEFKELGEVCEILRGKRLTSKELFENEKYPVIHGGTTPMGYYNKSNRKAGTTIVINTGNAGRVFFIDEEFWSSDACFSLYPNKFLMDKFLYYNVISMEYLLISKIRTGAMPTIDANAIKNLKIPIPPLEIQNEIVKILDAFSELTAELTARKKQYEYYRDK